VEADHHARSEIQAGELFLIESTPGARFGGSGIAPEQVGPYNTVAPEVSGTASIVGRHEFPIDPNDPFRHGFVKE